MSTPDLLEEILRKTPLFKGLEPDEVSALAQHFEMVDRRRGEKLCTEGEPGEALYLIESGKVRVHKMTASNFEESVAELKNGDVLGEIAALDGQVCSATATVTEKALLYRLDISAFTRLRLEASPAAYKVIRVLASTLCERLRVMNKRIRELQANPERVRQLIARRLRQQELKNTGVGLMTVSPHSSSQVAAKPEPTASSPTPARRPSMSSTAQMPIVVGAYNPGHDKVGARVAFLQQIVLLHSLSPEDFQTLAGLLGEENYGDGEAVFNEGDAARGLYIVASGAIDVCKQIVGDQAQVLATLRPGAMVGEVSLIDGGKRSATCIARGNTTLLSLSSADFDRLFSANNPLAFRFVEIIGIDLSLRLRIADEQFANIFDEENDAPKVIHKLDRVRKTLDTGEVNRPKLLKALKKLFKR